MTPLSFALLSQKIETVVHEHLAASRRTAEQALARAFAVGSVLPKQSPAGAPRMSRRRAPAEIDLLSEQLYHAVCAKPGETMTVLAPEIGAAARQLLHPMANLKRSGRVRSVGQRHLTRYFPVAARATKLA